MDGVFTYINGRIFKYDDAEAIWKPQELAQPKALSLPPSLQRQVRHQRIVGCELA